MHSRGVLANDREETLRAFRILQRAGFECLHKRDDRSQRRAQFVRNVRKKLLPNDLKPLGSRNIEEHAECAFRSLAIAADRNYAKIKDLSLGSMRLYFHAAALNAFETIEKRAVDFGVARQFSQTLRVQLR